MTEDYTEQSVQVGLDEHVTFVGKQVAYIPADPTNLSGVDTTLYETPEDGLKLHIREWETSRATDARPLGGEATRFSWTGGGLFSEEEARQRYPYVLEGLLQQKHINEELGR
jgi:hypothetical protein